MVKNNLRKIGKAIKCEQDLEKRYGHTLFESELISGSSFILYMRIMRFFFRNLEESAMDQLVEMAYKRMVIEIS